MLTDDEYETAKDQELPVLSPRGKTVWIVGMSIHNYFDETKDEVFDIDITQYEYADKRKRVMDTHTFKEFFELLPEHKQLVKQEEKDNHD